MPPRMLGLEGGGFGGSHIHWRRERVLARTLAPGGGGLGDPTLVRRRTKYP